MTSMRLARVGFLVAAAVLLSPAISFAQSAIAGSVTDDRRIASRRDDRGA